MLLGLLFTALSTSTALAHFTLDYPASRGFNESSASQFCGGFHNVGPRQPFPLDQGQVWIDNLHPAVATIDAFLSLSSNATSFNDFNSTLNGTTVPIVTSPFQVNGSEHCWIIDLASLHIGLSNGSLATLQIQYYGASSGVVYQCTDLVLLTNYTAPSNWTCTNNAALNVSSPSTTSSSTPAATSSMAATTSKSTALERQVASCGAASLVAGLIGLFMM